VLDLAATDGELAGEALNEALLHRLTSEAEMRALLDRRSGHPGSGVMRRILAEGGGDFSRQAGEKALRALIRDAGLPKPRRNVGAHGHELDFFWPELRLNVEMDGYRWHSTRARLNRDRRRDAELTARGITVLRFAYDQLEEPQRVVAQLAAAIALAGIST
jgi:very-short-patch-repair endonuclease